MKKSMVIFATLCFLLIFVVSGVGQVRKKNTLHRSAKIKKTLPTLYIQFEKILNEGKGNDERVLFRLQNNLIWSIRIETSGPSTKFEDSSLYYEIHDKSQRILTSRSCHVCSIQLLSSGNSVTFSIPRDEVQEAAELRIRFSYGWENDLDVYQGIEPFHHVRYKFADLFNLLIRKEK